MSDPPSGRRDSQGETWTWEPASARGSGRRPPWRPIVVAICALSVVGAAVGLILLSDDDSKRTSVAGRSATPAPTKARTATPSESTGNTPAPTRTGAGEDETTVELLAWSREKTGWFSREISGDTASLREGESIPVLLRLEGAVPGRPYAISVDYQCATDKGAAFDFLLAPDDDDAKALLTEPGPARARPDSMISIPDDQTIGFDNGADRRFQLWGATFQLSPQGPLPSAPCVDTKELVLAVVAQQPSVFLIWAGHLASAQNWGEGRGAAAQDKAVFVEASVTGTADSRVEVGPDVVEP